ncbi:hypothetical protein PG997_000592 [Apiospora hydei]|uniref:Uncharacterized protein n=1 Tax=Apiospora hydei TaxID=1337664 RepID=A0ABR1XBC0_9PEZI
MAPSYSTKQTGFSDDRRRSSGYGGGGGGENYQSYRPLDRERDRDRDNSRSGDKSSSRRESDPRDYRDDRDRERDRAKAREDLQLNTNIPTGPRILTSSAKSSPMSTTRGTGPPSYKSSIASKTAPSATAYAPSPQRPAQTAPKAKNPKLQPILDQLWEWEEQIRKRTIASAQRDKKKREMDERKRSMDSLGNNRNDHSSLFEAQQRLKERDKKEWDDINTRYRSFDEPMADYLENIATAIYFATMQPPPDAPSKQSLDPSALATLEKKMEDAFDMRVAALEKKMEEKLNTKVADLEKKMEETLSTRTAGLEKDLLKAQGEIEELKMPIYQTEVDVKELQSGLGAVTQTISDVEQKAGASAAGLLSSYAALDARQNQFQDDSSKVQTEVTTLMEDVSKDEVSEDIADLKRQAKEHEDKIGALNSAKPSPFLVGINDKLKMLVGEVAAIEQLRNDLGAVQTKAGKLEGQLRSLDLDALLAVANEWEESGAVHKLPKQEDDIEHLRRENQHPPVPDDDLRAEMRKEIEEGNRQKTEEINKLRAAMKTNIERLISLVQDTMTRQTESLAERVDELIARVEKLESESNQGPATQQTPHSAAENRTAVITDEQFDARIQVMKSELSSLLAEQMKREILMPCNTQLDNFRGQMMDFIGRVERLSLEVTTVNSQISHIGTKQLWDQMVGQVDQNYSMFGPRIEVNGKRLKQLEEKVASLIDRVVPAPPKRPGSPMGRPSSSGSMAKRQRMDNNNVAAMANAALAHNGFFGDLRPGGN